MPAAVIGLMGTLVASSKAASASARADETLRKGTSDTLAQKQKMFDIAQENLAPYRDIGTDAMKQLDEVFMKGNMDQFFESAGYKFNLAEGEKALQRKQSASGTQYGGAALKEAAQYSQGIASNEFQNFYNNLQGIAGIGANAAAGSASNAVNMGNSMGNTIQSGSTNLASNIMTGAANENRVAQGGLSNALTLQTYNDLKKSLTPQTPTTTTQPTEIMTNNSLLDTIQR